MTLGEIKAVVLMCSFPEYEFRVLEDGRGEMYLQACYDERDTVTGFLEKQLTRRWFLSPSMGESEIVQTAFKCIMTSAEHRVREWFKWNGQPVFNPHFDVNALHQLCVEGKFVHR